MRNLSARYGLVIFDLDGTILNTLDDLRDCLNRALAESGLPPRTPDEVRRFLGNGNPKLIEQAIAPCTDGQVFEKVYADFRALYRVHCRDKTRPYDGIPPLMKRLREAGCAVAVVSNKDDYAVQQLCDFYFPSLTVAAAGRTDDVPKKPAPEMVYRVLERTGIAKENAVMVGDSDVDLQTARNAGVPCISVTWGFRTREELAPFGVEAFADTPAQLERLLF